jgi:His-Xaa-Ser system protein HxsD
MNQFRMEFDLRVHSMNAVKKTAYRFSNRASASFSQSSEFILVVVFSVERSAELQEAEILKELLDQELREIVAEETKMVRDLIMAQAFSKISLVDPDGEGGTFEDDPLGIATSA